MNRRTLLLIRPVAALLAALSVPVAAQTAIPVETPPTVEDFFRFAQYARLKLSPNGKYLAAIVPVKGRRNLSIIDLEARTALAVTSMTDRDVNNLWWVNNNRLAFNVIDLQRALGEQRGSGLFAVNRDGTDGRELSPTTPWTATGVSAVFRYSSYLTSFAAESDKETDDILVLSNERNARYTDVYRMDTKTGRKTLLTFDSPGDVFGWVLDRNLVPRVAVVHHGGADASVHYRASEDSPWKQLRRFDAFKNSAEGFSPLAFDYEGNLIVSARAGADKAALYKYDIANNKLGEKLVSHKDYDLTGGLIFDSRKKALVGVEIEAERREYVWFDQDWATWQKMIDQALPGLVNELSRPRNSPSILVSSYSDKDPGSFYLFDPNKKQLERAVSVMPWIEPKRMAEQKFIRYTARDGTSIPAYLTLPAGRPAKSLPLVVLVHGGPYVRGETWRFDDEAQFLASRGYAVLQSDFRGSSGYGWKHYQDGWKQWGLSMQDDLNDGVEHLAKEGIVDRSRACIMGGSYGGYAVMMGLARDPELWKCGINFVGVTDLDLLQTATWSDTNQVWRDADAFYATHLGNRSTDRERFDKTSPIRHAARIKRPVFMAYGGLDRRVPIEHGDRMRSELRRTGVPHEYVVYDKEGHGFLLESNRVDLYKRVEKFLAENLK